MKQLLYETIQRQVCCLLLLAPLCLLAQTRYIYPLNNGFQEATGSAPALIPMPNDTGGVGTFADRAVASCTCNGLGGPFSGYDYPRNAGLKLNFPAAFINCEYSVHFTWQYDNPGGLQEWIKILSFVYTDDSGLNLWTQNPSEDATVHYWHLEPFPLFPSFCPPELGSLSPFEAMNDCEFYQMTITRQCNDTLKVYANGALLGAFRDVNQRYLPDPVSNQLVLFRDTADASCYPTPFYNEASPGFIRDLVVSDQAFSLAEVVAAYDTFCAVVLPITFQEFEVSPQKSSNQLTWTMEEVVAIQGFAVERSGNGITFTSVGEVFPDESLPGMPHRFMFLDRHPDGPRQFYRIKAIDLDGQVFFSRTEEVSSFSQWQLYPNPAQEFFWVEVPPEMDGQALEIVTVQGHRLRREPLAAGRHRIEISDLPPGLLLVRLGGGQAMRLVKIR